MTMLDHRDQEYQADRDDHKWRMDQAWLSGAIGEPTYLRSLFIIGYLPDEANMQLRILQSIKKEKTNEARSRLTQSIEYLKHR